MKRRKKMATKTSKSSPGFINQKFNLDMIKIKSAVILSAAAILLPFTTPAQQGTLGDEQINVVKAYQPMLSDAFKISDVPTRDTAVNYVPDMKYEIRSVKFPTVYTISPIKPLRIKDDNIKKLYHGYAKAGYGTKNTPYAELFYNSLRSKNMDAGVHMNHISSSGKIKNYGHPGMSETGIKLFGTRFFDSSKLGGEIGYNRLKYHWYGYNKPPDIFSKSETKRTFDDIFGSFFLKSNDRDKDLMRYKANVSFYDFSDNRKNQESDLKISGMAGKQFEAFDLSANLEFDFLKYKTEFFKTDNRTIIRIDPRFVKEWDRFTLTAGANIPVEINDLTKYHLYPHARIDVKLVEETMSMYAQLSGNLERNSFRNLAKENPFIGESIVLQNSNNKLDVSAGFKFKVDNQLAFIGSFSMQRYNDDVFYFNYFDQSTLVKYNVTYDNNTRTNIHLEVIYDQGDKAGVSVSADYFGNKPSKEDEALFRPDFKIGAKGYYTIGEKIYANIHLNYTGARNYVKYNFTGYDYDELKGFVDAGIGVDYRYSKVLSVWLQINNVTASKYSRWYNYPSYGFGGLVGLSYSF